MKSPSVQTGLRGWIMSARPVLPDFAPAKIRYFIVAAAQRNRSLGVGPTGRARRAQLPRGASGAADAFGLAGAMWLVAALTLISGIVVAVRMRNGRIRRQMSN